MSLQTLTHWQALKVTGPDAATFLQGQLSCDVNKAPTLGTCCNPQGRIVAIFVLQQLAEDFYLIMPKSAVAGTIAHLQKYAVFSKVELLADDKCIAVDIDKVATPALALQVSDEAKATADEQWHEQCIGQAIPWVYAETQEKFLPHYLNLHNLGALDFEKGCYTGQEIIARMQYKSQIKYGLKVVETDQAVTLGEKTASGEVVDSYQNEAGAYTSLVISKLVK